MMMMMTMTMMMMMMKHYETDHDHDTRCWWQRDRVLNSFFSTYYDWK